MSYHFKLDCFSRSGPSLLWDKRSIRERPLRFRSRLSLFKTQVTLLEETHLPSLSAGTWSCGTSQLRELMWLRTKHLVWQLPSNFSETLNIHCTPRMCLRGTFRKCLNLLSNTSLAQQGGQRVGFPRSDGNEKVAHPLAGPSQQVGSTAPTSCGLTPLGFSWPQGSQPALKVRHSLTSLMRLFETWKGFPREGEETQTGQKEPETLIHH